ncbi:MAG: hypothetical protein KC613_12105, partial [Myxococcales bacterium]|nr:hypothetical protein [Myxococcales bacterium]
MVRWGWGLAALLAVTACDDGGDGQGAGGTSGALTDAAAGAPGDATAGGGDLSPVEGDMAADEDMAPGADMSGQGDMMGADPDMMGVDPDMVAPDAGGACPPAGPFGTAVGDVAADLQLPDCDGTLHSVHAECGQPLWIFEFAAWCPPCR